MEPIEITEELLYTLYCAALDKVKYFLLTESETKINVHQDYSVITIGRPSYRDKDYAFHDDSHDDLSTALEIAERMRSMYYETDLQDLNLLINQPYNPESSVPLTQLADYACDGIAQAFYDLNCPALPKDID